MKEEIAIFWHRRDIRLTDNHGLYKALTSGLPVLPIFIFDENILSQLSNKDDARVSFIHRCIQNLSEDLAKNNKGIEVYHGKPLEVWQKLVKQYSIKKVFTNRDYEPYAQKRDQEVYEFLSENEIEFIGAKDHVIFEKQEILSKQETVYSVYTPYSKRWKEHLNQYSYQEYPSQEHLEAMVSQSSKLLSLSEIGFTQSEIKVPDYELASSLLESYKEDRDKPYLNGTSKLSPHLRFGTISVREVCRQAKDHSSTFINEIIWRDFYSQVLYNHPRIVNENYKKKYDAVKWRNNEEEFEKWCEGKTGFPIVDAGMRQLNQTGWMHNRVRMITASFLCKDLLVDWRWGEAYFAEKLLDFDLASNNGGWQWAAGTGTDAAPYFRVFNPESQLKKFDPDLKYVKKWIPEYGTSDYPEEMVNHKEARIRALEVYKEALG